MFRYIARRVIFSIPVLLISSVLVFVVIRANGDFLRALASNPHVSRLAVITVTFVILFNLLADIAYAFLDPRIRYA